MEEGALAIVALQRRIVEFPKPVLTRLHGAVRAGGIGIVAASDIAISAEDATYAFTEVKLALTPAAIPLTVLPRMKDPAAAPTFLTRQTLTGAPAAPMRSETRRTREE